MDELLHDNLGKNLKLVMLCPSSVREYKRQVSLAQEMLIFTSVLEDGCISLGFLHKEKKYNLDQAFKTYLFIYKYLLQTTVELIK